jgi:hypothetical protein
MESSSQKKDNSHAIRFVATWLLGALALYYFIWEGFIMKNCETLSKLAWWKALLWIFILGVPVGLILQSLKK